MFPLGTIFLSVGGAFLAVLLIPSTVYQDTTATAFLQKYLTAYQTEGVATSVILILLGVLLMAGAGLRRAVPKLFVRSLDALEDNIGWTYRPERAKGPADLATLRDMAVRFLGNAVSPLDEMKAIHKKNRNCFWLVYRYPKRGRRSQRSLFGYYIVYPLTNNAAALIEQGQLDGSNLTDIYVMSRENERNAHYIYIGAIVAEPGFGRHNVIDLLRQHLEVERGRRTIDRVFAKAATKAGLRLLTRHDFRPLSRSGAPCVGDMFHLPAGIDSLAPASPPTPR